MYITCYNQIGLSRLRLLKPIPDSIEEEDLDILNIQHSEIKIPDDDTTYWCSVHKLPDRYINKHHSIQVHYGEYISISQLETVKIILLSIKI